MSQETTARLIPRNQLRGSTINLFQPSTDLLSPCFLGVLIHFRIQAFHQWPDQRCTGFGRELERVLQNLRRIAWLRLILLANSSVLHGINAHLGRLPAARRNSQIKAVEAFALFAVIPRRLGADRRRDLGQ